MSAPKSSPETRAIARFAAVTSAAALALQAFKLRLDSSDVLPISFPDQFPISGLFALVVLALLFPLLARAAMDLIGWLDETVRDQVVTDDALTRGPRPLDDGAAITTIVQVNTKEAQRLGRYPQVIHWLGWAVFILEVILPIILSISILIYCRQSVSDLFEFPNSSSIDKVAICKTVSNSERRTDGYDAISCDSPNARECTSLDIQSKQRGPDPSC